jgi:hypothetical protein
MEEAYWAGRKRAAMSMARNASTAEARLIHYDLAGRYSLKADHSHPFLAAPPETPRDAPQPAAPTPQPFDGPELVGHRRGGR